MSLHRLRKSDTLPAVGRDVDTWCTKCKMELSHIIIAMVGSTPAQVRCNTCGSTHKYRVAKTASSGTSKTRSKAKTTGTRRSPQRKDEGTILRERFERQLGDRDRSEATTYSPRMQAAKGDLVDHKKFGYGVVQEVMGTKARMLFEDGERTLVVNR